MPQPGLSRPESLVTSVKVPLPLLRKRRMPPYCVTTTSGQPSLLTSPMATPMLWPAKSSPDPALTSWNRPSGSWR